MGKSYSYNFEDDDAIKLAKFHGSVNWRLGEPSNLGRPANTLDWQPMGFAQGMMEREIYHSQALLHLPVWLRYQPLGEADPFLVLPGYGKAFDVRANAPIWYKPEFAFATTHDVYIIGLSLADDDFFVKSFFLSNLPYIESYSGVPGRRIFIINPSEYAARNYEFVLRKGHAELFQVPFALEHIALMESRRAGA